MENSCSVCLSSTDPVVVRCFRVFYANSGNYVSFKCKCDHFNLGCVTCEHPVMLDSILETCLACRVINAYNIAAGDVRTVFRNVEMYVICNGPSNNVLGFAYKSHLVHLKWQKKKQTLRIVKSVSTNIEDLGFGVCYAEPRNMLLATFVNPCRVVSIGMHDGSRLWQFTDLTDTLAINPYALCSNPMGQLQQKQSDGVRHFW